jgi:hypothetical protein
VYFVQKNQAHSVMSTCCLRFLESQGLIPSSVWSLSKTKMRPRGKAFSLERACWLVMRTVQGVGGL